MEPRQVISGTEEEPRRSEEGQFLTSTRARGGRWIGALCSARLHHRQIKFISDANSCLRRYFAAVGERRGHGRCCGVSFNCAKSCSSTFTHFSLLTFIKNSSLDPDADMRVRGPSPNAEASRRRNAQIQFSNAPTSFDTVHHLRWENIQVISARALWHRDTKTEDGIFGGGWGGDIHKSHVKRHRCRKAEDAAFVLPSRCHRPVLTFSIHLYCKYSCRVSNPARHVSHATVIHADDVASPRKIETAFLAYCLLSGLGLTLKLALIGFVRNGTFKPAFPFKQTPPPLVLLHHTQDWSLAPKSHVPAQKNLP